MSNYNQSTFFAPKDSLSTGDAAKVIRGSELDPELAAISTAIGTKVDTAGAGLAKTSTTLALAPGGLTAGTPVLADKLPIADTSDADAPKRVTLTQVNAILAHDDLLGFVANEHVDHSGVTIEAGTGLSGGGTIAATRTLNLDINGLTSIGAYGSTDTIAVYDVSTTSIRKMSIGSINHDTLTGFVANEHIDHSGVSVIAGNGLSGGGTIAANRTLTLGTGGSVTATTSNATTASSHTHAAGAGIARFSTAAGGSITVSTDDPTGTPATNDIWIKREA